MAGSTYSLVAGEDLEHVEDMRIHATMYPNNASNLYRACMAGVRRQKYWMKGVRGEVFVRSADYNEYEKERLALVVSTSRMYLKQ